MEIKKSISILLLLLVSTCSILIADTVVYDKYTSLEFVASDISVSNPTPNSVGLPIIATYNPEVSETYYITSSLNENVNVFDGSSIQSYNTEYYDISTVGQTEDFILSYIYNLDKLEFSTVTISYDQQFYSTDRAKNTGVLLNLDYTSLLSDNSLINLHSTSTGTTSDSIYSLSGQILNYSSFVFKIKSGYHNKNLISFRFKWTPTSLEKINSNSSQAFSSGENLLAYVFVKITDGK